MMLTQLKITSAKPMGKPYNLADGQGLVLIVQTTGSKLWRFRYRYGGVQKTLHLGPWPTISLADAREKCREARKAIAAGLDPVLEKKRAKITAKFAVATTFKEVALEWIAKCEREGRADVTLDKVRWLLGMAYPLIGTLPINSITPAETLAVLRKVETKGRYESARRMRSVLSRIFRYGIATARCDRDVAADLRGALTTPSTSANCRMRRNASPCTGRGSSSARSTAGRSSMSCAASSPSASIRRIALRCVSKICATKLSGVPFERRPIMSAGRSPAKARRATTRLRPHPNHRQLGTPKQASTSGWASSGETVGSGSCGSWPST